MHATLRNFQVRSKGGPNLVVLIRRCFYFYPKTDFFTPERNLFRLENHVVEQTKKYFETIWPIQHKYMYSSDKQLIPKQ